jgi:acyl dehydratase
MLPYCGILTKREKTIMTPLYFEDLYVGQKLVSAGRTITEADIVMFAGLSGDYNPIHTNEEWCKNSQFKHRVAHGMLTASIASGLIFRLGFLDGTGMAHLGTTMKFMAPVFASDTIHVELEILSKKEVDQKRGIFTAKTDVVNQDNKIVETEQITIMISRKQQDSP